MTIKGEGIGRCDNCMKENTRIVYTVSPDGIQGQICIKCYEKPQNNLKLAYRQKKPLKDTSCLRDGEKDFARNLFETKQKSLEEELEREKDFYEKFGLYSTRDVEEIEDDLKKVKVIVSNIDNLPKCK